MISRKRFIVISGFIIGALYGIKCFRFFSKAKTKKYLTKDGHLVEVDVKYVKDPRKAFTSEIKNWISTNIR